jgi:hypothetical protein
MRPRTPIQTAAEAAEAAAQDNQTMTPVPARQPSSQELNAGIALAVLETARAALDYYSGEIRKGSSRRDDIANFLEDITVLRTALNSGKITPHEMLLDAQRLVSQISEYLIPRTRFKDNFRKVQQLKLAVTSINDEVIASQDRARFDSHGGGIGYAARSAKDATAAAAAAGSRNDLPPPLPPIPARVNGRQMRPGSREAKGRDTARPRPRISPKLQSFAFETKRETETVPPELIQQELDDFNQLLQSARTSGVSPTTLVQAQAQHTQLALAFGNNGIDDLQPKQLLNDIKAATQAFNQQIIDSTSGPTKAAGY